MSKNAILNSVDATSSVESILVGLRRLKVLTGLYQEENPVMPNGEPKAPLQNSNVEEQINPQEIVASITSNLNILIDAYNIMERKLKRFEQEARNALFNNLDGVLDRTIVDYQTGYEATLKYNEEWFSQVLLDEPTKIELAGRLLFYIEKFCSSNLKTLKNIAQGNPMVIESIRSR